MSGASKGRARLDLRRGCRFALAFLTLLIFGGWLAVELWIIPFATKRAEQELARLGYHVTYQDPDLSLLSGRLTLENLTLHRSAQKNEPLIFVSDLGIRLDLGALIWNQSILGNATIRRGNLTVFGKKRQPDFRKLAVDIEFDPRGMRIKKFSGESNLGYRLNLIGSIIWSSPPDQQETPASTPSDDDPSIDPNGGDESTSEQYPDFPGDLTRLEELADLFFCEPQGADLVSLELDLNWDQTKPIAKTSEGEPSSDPAVSLRGKVLGRDVLWKKFPLEQLQASFLLEDWEVAISEMKFTALSGEATASGRLDLETNRLLVDQVASSVNPLAVIDRLAPKLAASLARIEFDENPLLTGERITVDFEELRASKVILNVEAPHGFRVFDSPGDAEFLELSSIRGTLNYGDDNSEKLSFRDMSARINDLDVRGEIAIANFLSPAPMPLPSPPPPDARTAPPTGSDKQASMADARPNISTPLVALLRNLLQVNSDQKPSPRLDLDVVSIWSPDQQGPPAVEIRGQFSGSDFSWHDRQIESARINFGFGEQKLEIDMLEIIGLGGDLHASGSYDLEERVITIPKLVSSADIGHLKENLGISLPGLLDSVAFQNPPRFAIDDFELHLGSTPTGKGNVNLIAEHGFTIGREDESLEIDQFDLSMSWDAPHLLTVTRASGTIEDLTFDIDGAVHWQMPNALNSDPIEERQTVDRPGNGEVTSPSKPPLSSASGSVIGPSLFATISRYLTFTAAAEPVRIDGNFKWDETQHDHATDPSGSSPRWMEHLTIDATLAGKDFAWRGFSVGSSESKLKFRDGALQFLPFQIETSDGLIESRGSYAIAEKKLRVESLCFTVDPFLALARFGIPLDELDTSIDFLGTPKITGSNLLLDLDDLRASSGKLEADDLPGIVLNLPGGREMIITEFRGPLAFGDGEFRGEEIRAKFFGGAARIDFTLAPFGDSPSYTSAIEVQGISIAEMSDWLEPENGFDEEGTFDLTFDGIGTSTLESLAGRGRAVIGAEGGSARHLPMLRGLVDFIDGGLHKDWIFDLPFDISDGKIETAAGTLGGHSISVHLSGSVDWANDHVDLMAGVNPNGLIGIVTSIATPMRSDLIEIIGRGTLDNVEWGTKHHMEPHHPRHYPWKPLFGNTH